MEIYIMVYSRIGLFMPDFLKPLRNVVDFIEETQTSWAAGNGFNKINGTNYLRLPKTDEDLFNSLGKFINCDPSNAGWHVAVVDIPAFPDFSFVVYRFPKTRAKQ
jgi:hypothetical protein